MKKYLLIPLLFSIIGWFFLTFRILDVPPGINGDEVAIGLIAVSISKTGYDSQNRFLPLFTNINNSPDWKQPITIYTTALMFKLFGISYFNLRSTSIIFVILSIFSNFLLVKEVINKKVAFISLILFLTTPIIVIQSHLAIENIAPVPFVSIWLLMLVKYTKKSNSRLLLYAGLFLGISVFSYLGMRMIAPVLAVLTILYILVLDKSLNKAKWFLMGFTPFVLILLLSKFYYPGAVLGQFRPYKIEDYQALLLPYISIFDPSFLFIQGDATPYHSTGKHGMFLLASLPLFIFGVVNIIRNKKPILWFILISFFTAPLLFGLGSTVHRASRLLALVPFYIVISSIGVQTFFSIKRRLYSLAMITLALLLIGFNFADFIYDYWYQYPQRVKVEFAKPIHQVFQKLAITAKNNNLNPYIEYYLFKQYPDAENLFKLIYFPQGLSKWYREKRTPAKSVILTDLNDIPSKEKVDIVRVDNLDYYFIINRSENEI